MQSYLLIAVGFVGVAGLVASAYLIKLGFTSAGRWLAERVRQVRGRASRNGAQHSDSGE